MKLAQFWMTPALLLAWCASASAQMMGPGMMPPGAPFPGQPTSFAGPAPYTGGEAAAGAMSPESIPGAYGGFQGQDCFGDCGPGHVHGRSGYGYFSMDALYWDRDTRGGPALVRQTGTAITLYDESNVNYEFEVLPRLTGGYVLGNGVAVEGTYFYKDDFSVRERLTIPATLDMVAFGAPPIASPFLAADSVGVNTAMKMQSAEINLVETERFFNFLAGFRYIELRDQTLVTTMGANGNGLASFHTYNKLFGGQAGVRMAHNWGLIGVEAQGKAGMFFNDASSMTDSNTGNTGYVRGQNESFLGELQIMATIRSTSCWQYRIGYNAMWLMQTAMSFDQILDTAATGTVLNAKSDLFIHGPFAGAEYRW